MSWWKKIVAASLLLLWMPATSHCALESVGLLPHAVGCVGGGSHCGGDACKIIETGLFKQTTVQIKAIPPEFLFCTCFLCLQLIWASPPSLVAVSDFTPVDFEGPPDWVARWSFEHRAALPARAPSLV